ncbi:MAG: hypothetical protein KatS3mg064_2372 [Tepidiforma sp.]|nr:DUF2298 domain-containing protein [Tepidiforma sp.]GIW19215.1 MAG: hypothetical protein KatS3mg064_2372 [Tepidiforma sp.]
MAETSPAVTPARGRLAALRSGPIARLLTWQAGLAAVLLLGAVLRFHGLGWDRPAEAAYPLQMHPDERFLSLVANRIDWPGSVGGYFDTARSPLNPYNDGETNSYVYGTFPLFLVKAVATLRGDDPPGPGNSYAATVVSGRQVTAAFDALAILLVFLLGSALGSRRLGLLAALLYALAVLPTQLAHFWAMDPYLNVFALLTLLLSVHWVRAEGPRAWWLAIGFGASIGLATACKVNGAIFAAIPVLAFAVRIALYDLRRLAARWDGSEPPPRHGSAWLSDLSMLCLAGAVSLLVFRVAQPYAFAGPHVWDFALNQRWWDDIQRERDFQQGNVDYPPFIQFAGTTPFLTALRNITLWGLGPVLAAAAFAGLIAAAVRTARSRDLVLVLPLAFALLLFGFWGPRFVAFMRYFLPMYPVLCLFAAWGLLQLLERSRAGLSLPRGRVRVSLPPPRARVLAFAALAIVLGASAWWALAFQRVYLEEHPRIAATRWVYANVPPGSAITTEIWDDPVPWDLPGRPRAYRLVELDMYRTDSPEKIRDLVFGVPGDPAKAGLAGADYVAVTSNRIRDSVTKLEREYPATIRYYQLLESGDLGFQRVATFTVHPSFLSISVDDSGAEESFTVYDHPEVRIYRKTAAFDPARAYALLSEARPEAAVNLLPRQGRSNGLQFTAAEAEIQQSGGTFADVFDAPGWMNRTAWVWWLLWLQAASLAAVPWVTWLFRPFAGRGYGLAKLFGPLAVVLFTWMAVAWGPFHFSKGLAWAAFAAVLAGGVAVGLLRRSALRDDLRGQRRNWLAAEAVFLLAFAAFLLLRMANPDLWHHPQGGEKPMEVAYFTAVVRSTILPPYDPWFAGGSLNYYYMGWFYLAVPVRAFGILPEYAFNLGVPTFAATAAAAAFAIISGLVGAAAPSIAAVRRRAAEPLLAGAFAAFLLVAIGNLDAAHQWVERLQALNQWSFASGTPVLGGAVGFAGGLWRWLFGGAQLPPFDWWRSSRVHFGSFDITEFPYWSFLFADLHPHLMGIPFFVSLAGTGAALALSAARGDRLRPWVLAAVAGLFIGLIRTVHTWDFPTAALLAAGAIALAGLLAPGSAERRAWTVLGQLALAGLVAAAAFAPYNARFETFDPGITRAPATTPLHQFVVQYGVFLALTAAFVALRCREELEARGFDPGRNPVLAVVAGRLELVSLAVFLAGLIAFTWPFGLATVAMALAALAFLMNLAWLDLRASERDVPRLIATLFLALAVAIAAGVDIVTLKNDIVRMNTVFKFSLQAWHLFALGGGYAAWYTVRGLVERARGAAVPARGAAGLALAALAAVVVASSLFLVSGTRARQEARFGDTPLTLNGFAFFEHGVFTEPRSDATPADDVTFRLDEDLPLIAWLRQNVEGSPVIVEAVGPLYRWTGRISQYTGLPAVIGWDWHQIQQRTDYAHLVQERRTDVQLFYTDPSTDRAERFLRKYDVRYVVVGTEERVHGTEAGLAKFAAMPALTEVFRDGPNVIYRVDQDRLAADILARDLRRAP